MHLFVSKLSSKNSRFRKSLKASDTHLLSCKPSQLCISLNGGKDSTAVFFLTLYLLLRAESAKKENLTNPKDFSDSWDSFQGDLSQKKLDHFLFEEAFNSLHERSLLCVYLKEKEPFPEILHYLDFLKEASPIDLKIYNSPQEVDPEFIKNVKFGSTLLIKSPFVISNEITISPPWSWELEKQTLMLKIGESQWPPILTKAGLSLQGLCPCISGPTLLFGTLFWSVSCPTVLCMIRGLPMLEISPIL